MRDNPLVLIAGRSGRNLQSLEQALREQPGLNLYVREMSNGSHDPLQSLTYAPDMLVLDLGDDWEEELKALGARPKASRPPMVVVGAAGNTQIMRMAMQAGARDFFTHPVAPEELRASVQAIAKESTVRTERRDAALIAFMNAKGGCGASFVAANLAHTMVAHLGLRVALIDLDLQFGNLPLYLDLAANNGLLYALESTERLDAVALNGYMTKHHSGLHLLTAMQTEISSPWSIPEENLHHLLNVAQQSYDYIVVDLPRQIDPLTRTVLESADQVMIVMQQTLGALRGAKHLTGIIKRDLAVPSEHISVVVNRHQVKSEVGTKDVTDALRAQSVYLVPNDSKRVFETLNGGVPIFEYDRTSAVARGIQSLAEKLSGRAPRERKGLLHQVLAYRLS